MSLSNFAGLVEVGGLHKKKEKKKLHGRFVRTGTKSVRSASLHVPVWLLAIVGYPA